jgi:diaminohydroxyphosphoribosylaminopyrimidine deaminase / 5-amino-6-(5-phosphoribosylamino)uracil reductase
MNHESYMLQAIQLAKKGLYTTDPNPRVGCIIVKDDQVVGTGFHVEAGSPHAEVHALRRAGHLAKGATAYVTLEPCSHTGRTPPCADALVASGVNHVVIGMIDPNPSVSGNGIKKLQQAGIKVTANICQQECENLNPGFIKRMKSGMPFVRLKIAMSIDGRTAMADGSSHWITGAEARQDVQYWRSRSSAIVTGIGTFEHDDPKLNARPGDAVDVKQPIKVLLDSAGKANLSRAFFKTGPVNTRKINIQASLQDDGHREQKNIEPIWWCTNSPLKKEFVLPDNVVHKQFVGDDGRVDLKKLIQSLGNAEVNEVLFECGANLAGSVIKSGLLDQLIIYMAPKIMGSSARPMATIDISKMTDAYQMDLESCQTIGSDIRMVFNSSRH